MEYFLVMSNKSMFLKKWFPDFFNAYGVGKFCTCRDKKGFRLRTLPAPRYLTF